MWTVLAPLVTPDAPVTLLAAGHDSLALAIDHRVVVKRPKNPEAQARLRREAALLRLIRPRVPLPVPDLHLVEGPPPWSWHPMLQGTHLPPGEHDALPPAARTRLASDLARFLAAVHATPLAQARAAGATDLPPWPSAAETLRLTLPVLPPRHRPMAQRLALAHAALPPDPGGLVFGQFDGHGWNLAFDAKAGALAGIYDFADAGIGPRHQDFLYAGLISLDLMGEVARAYAALTGLPVDLARITHLAGMHRLWELACQVQAGQPVTDHLDRLILWAHWARHQPLA